MSIDYRSVPDTVHDLIESSNQFIVAGKNPMPEVVPEARVATWSSVFGSGGSVALEVKVDGDRVDLARVQVEDNHDARDARELLARPLEEWNEDPRRHWTELVEAQRESVLEYARRQAKEYAEKVARYEAGDWS